MLSLWVASLSVLCLGLKIKRQLRMEQNITTDLDVEMNWLGITKGEGCSWSICF